MKFCYCMFLWLYQVSFGQPAETALYHADFNWDIGKEFSQVCLMPFLMSCTIHLPAAPMLWYEHCQFARQSQTSNLDKRNAHVCPFSLGRASFAAGYFHQVKCVIGLFMNLRMTSVKATSSDVKAEVSVKQMSGARHKIYLRRATIFNLSFSWHTTF